MSDVSKAVPILENPYFMYFELGNLLKYSSIVISFNSLCAGSTLKNLKNSFSIVFMSAFSFQSSCEIQAYEYVINLSWSIFKSVANLVFPVISLINFVISFASLKLLVCIFIFSNSFNPFALEVMSLNL